MVTILMFVLALLLVYVLFRHVHDAAWWAGPAAIALAIAFFVFCLVVMVATQGPAAVVARCMLAAFGACGGAFSLYMRDVKRQAWGGPVAIACLLLTLIMVILHWRASGPSMKNVEESETAFRHVAGERLGTYLADRFPDASIRILVPPATVMTPERDALLAGLRKGLGDQRKGRTDTQSPTITPPPDAAADDTGYLDPEMWYTAECLDRFMRQTPPCDLVITILGLPPRVSQMPVWALDGAPRLAAVFASATGVEDLVRNGKIAALVGFRTGGQVTPKSPSRDTEKAFAERFVLVTPDSVAE